MSILQGREHLDPAGASQSDSPGQPTEIPTVTNLPAEGSDRVRMGIVGAAIAIGVACLIARAFHPFDWVSDESRGWILDRLLPRLESLVGGWSPTMMLVYPVGVLAIFLLERWMPAVPSQRTIGTGVIHDVFWILIKAAARLVLFTGYSTLIYRFYVQYLSFLSIPLGSWLPTAAGVVVAVVLADFVQWFQHWLHHNVKWLWPFHAVHHSQRELNLFSDYRVHSMEYIVRRPLSVLPMLILGLQAPEVTWWLLLTSWHTRMQHANIRANFGPLRYLIVTPQSHRVHHSRRPEHFNQNYGSIFSFWDYLFGTRCKDSNVYPETGIADESFPAESGNSIFGVLQTLLQQLIYPFRQIGTMLKQMGTPAQSPSLATGSHRPSTPNIDEIPVEVSVEVSFHAKDVE